MMAKIVNSNARKREHRHRVNARRLLTCSVCGRVYLPHFNKYELGPPICSVACVERGRV